MVEMLWHIKTEWTSAIHVFSKFFSLVFPPVRHNLIPLQNCVWTKQAQRRWLGFNWTDLVYFADADVLFWKTGSSYIELICTIAAY